MVYNVIGLMSGSSLDGLDIAFVTINQIRNEWTYEIKETACIAFDNNLKHKLATSAQMHVSDFLRLHTYFGNWMGQEVNQFIENNNLTHKVHFIASHGHTAFHDPKSATSTQIGDGAAIAAITGLATITNLRNMDVALGGQGAPIVAIADQLFFKDYKFCLNLGGIANVTINDEHPLAFDICPANQILNYYAQKKGLSHDTHGALARSGNVDSGLLHAINDLEYFVAAPPKSLANEYATAYINLADNSKLKEEDILATFTTHIAQQIANAIAPYSNTEVAEKILITGGGVFNTYLVEKITQALNTRNIETVVAENILANNKEALAMALMGVLRWREENNVLGSVTGARRNSIGGAIWLGQ